jgi:hypothetical protein
VTSRAAAFAVLCGLAACSGSPPPSDPGAAGALPDAGVPAGAPAITAFDPDVPAWRGGCFFAGPPGKVVNGSPSPDVRMFGRACDGSGGQGGLVYLDRYDPVAGTGDVTVLLSGAGARPVIVGARGGAGGTIPGSTGARLNDGATLLLTLSDVASVSGTLQLVTLFPAPSPRAVADRVRVENYDFLPGDAALFVGNYDAARRVGDLYYLPPGGAPQTIAVGAARVEFILYHLSPDRRRVAYLRPRADGSLALEVSALPPAAAPTAVDVGVAQLAWTSDGARLVYVVASADGQSGELAAWEVATGAKTVLAKGVDAASVVGNDVVYAQGATVLSPSATLHVAPAAGGADAFSAPAASLEFEGAVSAARGRVVAFAVLPDVADPFSGDLFLEVGGAAVLADRGITPAAGYLFSPSASFVAYAKGFAQPQASGNPGAQPGIARELAVASPSGARFTLAADASFERVAWAPDEGFVAAIGAFDPARGSGALVVKRAPDGADAAPGPLAGGVSTRWFGFTDDGAALAAIRGWDAGRGSGELVLLPTSGTAAWTAAPLAGGAGFGATSFVTSNGRVLYGVRGDGRDGLWLAP